MSNLDNFDPDAYWCFDRKPVSLSDYGWDPYSSHERTGETARDSAGLTFGPTAGPEADDPDAQMPGRPDPDPWGCLGLLWRLRWQMAEWDARREAFYNDNRVAALFCGFCGERLHDGGCW